MMKNNVRKNRTISLTIARDFIVVILCAWVTFYTIDGLVEWVTNQESGFISKKNLGFLSGFLMVLPNGLLAFYYSAKGRSDIAYSSQIGDCHICIPLCLGLYAISLTHYNWRKLWSGHCHYHRGRHCPVPIHRHPGKASQDNGGLVSSFLFHLCITGASLGS